VFKVPKGALREVPFTVLSRLSRSARTKGPRSLAREWPGARSSCQRFSGDPGKDGGRRGEVGLMSLRERLQTGSTGYVFVVADEGGGEVGRERLWTYYFYLWWRRRKLDLR